jgi:signal transduction histidine kinase
VRCAAGGVEGRPGDIHAPGGWRLTLADLAVAALVGLFQLFGTWSAAHHQHSARPLGAGGTVLLLTGPVALLFVRRAPLPVFAVTLAVTVTYVLIDYPRGPVFVSVLVALLAFVRERRAQARAALRREERLRRDDERLRLAQELHDVLAHSTAVISVQAGVALHLMDTHPEQVRRGLEAIRDASAQSMRELRAAIDALRSDPEQSTGGANRLAAPVADASRPGLATLDTLTASAAAAGVEVRPAVEGERRRLRPELDLAAYRIIQESLTNAARHAGPGVVSLRVRYEDEVLVLQIDSHGQAGSERADRPGGRGLLGMRERAAALHGTVRAGPTAEGGFQVLARLPYGESPGPR